MSINSSTKVRAWLRAAAFDQPSCMAEDSPDAPGGEQEDGRSDERVYDDAEKGTT